MSDHQDRVKVLPERGGRLEAPKSDIWTALCDLSAAIDSGEAGSIEVAQLNAKQVIADARFPWEKSSLAKRQEFFDRLSRHDW